MQGGLLAKARRGELKLRLPAGLAYDAVGIITLDPDTEVRGALQLLLNTFTATGSARAVVAAFNAASLTFPGRHQGGPHAGELYFKPLTHDHVLDVLHNPAYAGTYVYVYGRGKTSTDMDGRVHSHLKPVTEWTVCIRDHHPGYLTWAQYERNQAVLAANAASRGEDRKAGPGREGSALLQGVVICGRCGRRMSVGYHTLANRTRVPAYHCQRAGIRNTLPACQAITGAGIDAAISALICGTLTPLAAAAAWPSPPSWPPTPARPTRSAPPTCSAPRTPPTPQRAATGHLLIRWSGRGPMLSPPAAPACPMDKLSQEQIDRINQVNPPTLTDQVHGYQCDHEQRD